MSPRSPVRLIRLLKKDLAAEVSTWVDGDLISIEQARSICRVYGIDYDEIRKRSSAYRVLVVLGCLFIGLALITVIGANWNAIPRELRLGGLLVLTAGTHALAIRQHLAGHDSAASGLIFLGNLFFGASIILVAQTYHLGEHMPDVVFWWALGTVPFAVLLRNPWLTLMSGLLALAWLYLEYRTAFLSAAFLAAVFPLFLAAELYVLARARSNVPLFLTFVASLVLWFMILLAIFWADGRGAPKWTEELVFVGAALFLFAHGAALRLHTIDNGKAKDYGAVLSIWFLRLSLAGVLVLSFERPWDELLHSAWDHQGSMWVVVAGLVSASLWMGRAAGNLRALLALSVVSVGAMVAVVVIKGHVEWSGREAYALWFQVLGNVALVAVGIWLIARGAASGVSQYFFLGVAAILLTALMRYVDLIGDYVGGAVLFLVFAGLLLGCARYWKSRQAREVLGT